MTLAQTKQQLIQLIQNPDLKVIALSGEWGCGKTHLWDEIRRESNFKKIQVARYISLFGVRDINQLKLKIVQSMLPEVARGNLVSDGVTKLWATAKDALKKVHPAFTAIDELALVAVPAALRNQFVIIDDLERKNSALEVDEVLGFVDEYTKRFGTRFLLILNSDQLSRKQDNAFWEAFREKVVDEELRLSLTPNEALEIAVPDVNAMYRPVVKKAVEACGLTNIRVIRIAYKLIIRLLGTNRELASAVLNRTIPSIILISATHNRAIKDGPDLDFIKGFNRGTDAWLDKYLSGRNSDPVEDAHPAAWKLLMSKLNISSADEFEELVVSYVCEGDRDIDSIEKTISNYIANEKRLSAQNSAESLIEKIRWEISTPQRDLVSEAQRLLPQIKELDANKVSLLHDLVSVLEDGQLTASRMIDAWIDHIPNVIGSIDFGTISRSFNEKWHPRLKEAIDATRKERAQDETLVEAMLGLVGREGWGNKEESALKAATVEDFVNAMRTLKGREFKMFILKSLDILEQGQAYEKYFGNAGTNFLKACREILLAEGSSRFGRLLREVFAESNMQDLLMQESLQNQNHTPLN